MALNASRRAVFFLKFDFGNKSRQRENDCSPSPMRWATSVLIIHNSCLDVINEITLSACNLPILNVTLGLAVLVFDERWRNTEAGVQREGATH